MFQLSHCPANATTALTLVLEEDYSFRHSPIFLDWGIAIFSDLFNYIGLLCSHVN